MDPGGAEGKASTYNKAVVCLCVCVCVCVCVFVFVFVAVLLITRP